MLQSLSTLLVSTTHPGPHRATAASRSRKRRDGFLFQKSHHNDLPSPAIFFRATFLVSVTTIIVKASNDCNGSSCVVDAHAACKSSFYTNDCGCLSCKAAHCEHCETFGWCTVCRNGYKMEYLSNISTDLAVSRYGECVNAASSTTFTGAFVVSADALFDTLIVSQTSLFPLFHQGLVGTLPLQMYSFIRVRIFPFLPCSFFFSLSSLPLHSLM